MSSGNNNVQFTSEDLESRLSPTDNHLRQSSDRARSLRSEPSEPLKSPSAIRRATRSRTSDTFRTVDHVSFKPNWHAGQEPGLDPSAAHIQHEECQITVVDYSEEDIKIYEHDNASLIKFLEEPQEPWVKVRWINVNGLSWDVVQALAKNKRFHKLATEDLMSRNNRTKADWYPEHTYVAMTLQKLIRRETLADKRKDEEESNGGFFSNPFGRGAEEHSESFIQRHTRPNALTPRSELKTIQRYFGGQNYERADYMERHSALAKKNLVVSAEQVSIFLMGDNTVIAFFEHSADDLEAPIIKRLSSPDTVLRQSGDATMLLQALVDGIIDLAIPILTSYQEIIGELELNVLTEPNIKHTTSLYILASELTKIRNFISPGLNLVNALREHKESDQVTRTNHHGDVKVPSTVCISPMTSTYLSDVEDHIILVTEGLDGMRHACDNMIDLIFNVISAYQNESMKQLTVVTIIFLPLSFMTGYFGMNITNFPSINNSESYFWIVATPVSVVVGLFLMKDIIRRYITKMVQRRSITQTRRGRIERAKKA